MNPSKEEIVTRIDEIRIMADEIEAERKELSQILMEQMQNKEELIADFIVKKVTVTKYKPTNEWAEEMGALVMKPTIDMAVVKKIASTGVDIPKEEFTYIKMQRVECN